MLGFSFAYIRKTLTNLNISFTRHSQQAVHVAIHDAARVGKHPKPFIVSKNVKIFLTHGILKA